MTDKKPTGGLAFPAVLYNPDGQPTGQDLGMTLRDWFAGQALIGALAYSPSIFVSKDPAEVAERVYRIADAMVVERDK